MLWAVRDGLHPRPRASPTCPSCPSSTSCYSIFVTGGRLRHRGPHRLLPRGEPARASGEQLEEARGAGGRPARAEPGHRQQHPQRPPHRRPRGAHPPPERVRRGASWAARRRRARARTLREVFGLGPARAVRARGAGGAPGPGPPGARLPPPGRRAASTSASPSPRWPPREPARRGYLLVFQDLTDIKRLEQEVRMQGEAGGGGGDGGPARPRDPQPAGLDQRVRPGAAWASPTCRAEQERLLAIITRESKRLSDTLNQFLFQARPAPSPRGPGGPRALIEEAVTLLRNGPEVGPAHQVEFEADGGPHVCLADPDQITQVFWNLARNGLEAMPGGRRAARPPAPRDGDELVLSVPRPGAGHGPRGAAAHVRALPVAARRMGTGLGPGHRLPHRARAPRATSRVRSTPAPGHRGRGAPARWWRCPLRPRQGVQRRRHGAAAAGPPTRPGREPSRRCPREPTRGK